MKINKGDVVRLKPLKVDRIDSEGYFHSSGIAYRVWASQSLIDSVEPRPLQPGDDVLWPPKGNKKLRIIFIEEDDAWLADGENRFTVRLSLLTRA